MYLSPPIFQSLVIHTARGCNKSFPKKLLMIIGREGELERFEMIFKSKKAEFFAVYGRRRVGKMHQQIHSFVRIKVKKSWFCFLMSYRG